MDTGAHIMTGIYPSFSLPDKLSDLLDLALEDLEKAEADPDMRIDMATWYDREYPEDRIAPGICSVCMAGTVLAQRANLPMGAVYIDPSDFSDEIRGKLYAINSLRMGYVYDAFCKLGLKIPAELEYVYFVYSYEGNPTKFKRDMKEISKLLREHGH